MRIFLMNQFFWPDSSATSQLLTDLARGLIDEGHEVTAICADGSYTVRDDGSAPAMRVYRVKSFPFQRGKLGRILSYLSFYIGASLYALFLPRPDLVLTLTTPPLLSLLGTMVKKMRGARHFIWEMDIYPDVAIDLNYFKAGGILDRGVGFLADYSRREADGVIALGECMKQRLVDRAIPPAKISVADNWADGRNIKPVQRHDELKRLVLLYSGNLGLAHDIETFEGAMLALKEEDGFLFRFVGSGGRRAELASFCKAENIRSVEMLPYVQRASLSESLAAGDIGLVTQRDVCCGSVVPSKVYGLMAAGRPILYIGPREATPARIIRRFGCGWHINCGDVDGLTNLLLHLGDERSEVQAAGQRARQAFLDHYDLPLGVARIAGILSAVDAHRTSTEVARRAA